MIAGRLNPLRKLDQRGVSLVELVCVSVILVVLATIAVPVVTTVQRRHRELELRQALRTMRQAIDDYKRLVGDNPALQGGTILKQECEGYPCELEDLVEGVDLGLAKEIKIKFLRRIPVDPMTGSTEWGLRSSKQEPDDTSWDRLHVFDVYTLSEGVDADGTPYRSW
jgi:general secretion pathway protein G